MLTVVHVTHEAVQKIGGIGSVLEGLVTSAEYSRAVDRTIFLCPLFSTQGEAVERLGPGGEVLYSSLDGLVAHPMAGAFLEIQQRFHVEIVYGRRILREPLSGTEERPEVILLDIGRMNPAEINVFKHKLFEAFGISSTRYEQSWDYEQYVRIAEPGLAVVKALGGAHGDCVIVAHEFMGIPTALAATLQTGWRPRTAFYAHEVSPIRRIIEDHPGHDTMFYNVLRKSREEGLYISDVFGDQFNYFRHALVEASRFLDVTLAVGDEVVREMQFLSPEVARSNIQLCYNGIPAYENAEAQSHVSKVRLQDYAERLLGHRPDYIFTHVTRLVPSKGLWRDLGVMKYIERSFRDSSRTAVLFVLSTEIGGPRRREDILEMEKWWDWPVGHREGPPDLTHGEAQYYAGVQAFNARAANCKIVFINQFGFDSAHCGERMSREMEFWDIRKGSDIEFGQSVYEPFGIAQLEALSFGCMCVMTNVCGCAFFVQRVAGPGGTPNVLVADYTDYHAEPDTIAAYKAITREQREAFDDQVAEKVAAEVVRSLPQKREQKGEFIRRGYELAAKMSWDVIARDYFLPAIRQITSAVASNVA
jgi:glycosyltransferase involved in cell wall biosynthesis